MSVRETPTLGELRKARASKKLYESLNRSSLLFLRNSDNSAHQIWAPPLRGFISKSVKGVDTTLRPQRKLLKSNRLYIAINPTIGLLLSGEEFPLTKPIETQQLRASSRSKRGTGLLLFLTVALGPFLASGPPSFQLETSVPGSRFFLLIAWSPPLI